MVTVTTTGLHVASSERRYGNGGHAVEDGDVESRGGAGPRRLPAGQLNRFLYNADHGLGYGCDH